ncbi:MAG: 30S ribosomal protein S17 [Candidatus Methylacidiphilales bacterium]|nr:30S ribosomal protein S17 [Candidatus Methylacidiphilales bacterium]
MTEATATAPAPGKNRKVLLGEVVSNKMEKTIVVKVTRKVPHPQFKKLVKKSKKFYAHDEAKKAQVGDKVRIGETRPLSRLKRWEVLEILKKS